jgi:release factor glutamine methyltransferase
MNIAQALQQSASGLNSNGIVDCHIEARLLLGYATNLSAVQIFTEPQRILSQEEEDKLTKLIERRLQCEPTAYILKEKEFYGLDFYVDHRVLIPRPETELLVDAALNIANNRVRYLTRSLLMADIGTGCGAIAISLALNLPKCKVYAIDLSSAALEVAELNCQRNKVNEQVRLLHGDLLTPLPESVDIVVANLPYIQKSDLPGLSPEIAKFEPQMALDGGENGLDCIEKLLRQIKNKINSGGSLILEIGEGQEEAIRLLVDSYIESTNFRCITDLNEIKRVVIIDL